MKIVEELNRRNVFRVAIAYAVTCWLLVQALDLAAESFGAPGWVMKMIIVLLIIGFIPVVLFSWAYELTPDGLRRERDVSQKNIDHRTARRLDLITLTAAICVAALVAWQQMTSQNSPVTTASSDLHGQSENTQETIDSAVNSQRTSLDKTIAVLPFVNLSADKENEYFSDGIAEELLNELVRVDGLQVTSRTSAFSFKNKEVDIPTVAKALRVKHIVEGSVRRQGNQVRIAAQLIDASSDKHLWSHIYTRELTDIFVIQGEIAIAIAQTLELTLLGDNSMRAMHNIEAYDRYLLGLHWFHQRTPISIPKAIELFEQVIALDPNFAPAYSGLADAYSLIFQYGDYDPQTAISKAKEYANTAVALDPELAEAHASVGLSLAVDGDRDSARKHYNRAIQLNPDYSMAHMWLGTSYSLNPIKALEAFHAAERVDPLNPIIAENIGATLHLMGHYEESVEHLQNAIDANPDTVVLYRTLCAVEFTRGRFDSNYRWARRAVAADSRSPQALVNIVYAETDLGNFDSAEAWLRRYELAMPNHAEIGHARVSLHQSRGNLDAEIAEITNRMVGPQEGFYSMLLGNALIRSGRYQEALDILHSLQKGDIGNANYVFTLAGISLSQNRLGQQQLALATAEKGLSFARELREAGINQPWITQNEAILLAASQQNDLAISKVQVAFAQGDRNIYGYSALYLLDILLGHDDRYLAIKRAMYDDVLRQKNIINAEKLVCVNQPNECALANIEEFT